MKKKYLWTVCDVVEVSSETKQTKQFLTKHHKVKSIFKKYI